MSNNFDTLWTNELEPWLAEREVEYRAMVRRGRKFALITLGISLVIVGILWLALALDTERLLIALAVALLASGAAWITGSSGIGALSTQIKHQVLNRLAAIFDLNYASKPAETTRFRRFQELGILPTATRQSFGDHFSGHSNGTDFELYEAHLEQRHTRTVTTKNGTRTETYYVTVFQGALIRINFPSQSRGHHSRHARCRLVQWSRWRTADRWSQAKAGRFGGSQIRKDLRGLWRRSSAGALHVDPILHGAPAGA